MPDGCSEEAAFRIAWNDGWPAVGTGKKASLLSDRRPPLVLFVAEWHS